MRPQKKLKDDLHKFAKPPSPYHSDKHLRQFSDITSQELNTVLGALAGELDFTMMNLPDHETQQIMRRALQTTERALNLARNLHYFSVHSRLDPQPIDMSQLVLDTLDMVEQDFEGQGIRLIVFVESSLFVVVDGHAIQQVVFNLLSNAMHAMPTGGQLRLNLRSNKRSIELSVSDTGLGIAAEHLDRIFEPYFLARINRHTDSRGLGLAVIKALVEAHAGQVEVTSMPSEGTTFTVNLPYDPKGPRPEPFREKRRHHRVQVSLVSDLIFREKPPLQTELLTLSLGGGFVVLSEAANAQLPKIDDTAKLVLYYYDNRAIEIPKVRVASLCRIGRQTGIGLEFLEFDPKSERLLAALVKSHAG